MASVTTWSICNGLDEFESINAAEWDEGSVSQISADQQEITCAITLELENEKVRLSSYLRDQIHCVVLDR
jgi:hypothetical protein